MKSANKKPSGKSSAKKRPLEAEKLKKTRGGIITEAVGAAPLR